MSWREWDPGPDLPPAHTYIRLFSVNGEIGVGEVDVKALGRTEWLDPLCDSRHEYLAHRGRLFKRSTAVYTRDGLELGYREVVLPSLESVPAVESILKSLGEITPPVGVV